MTRATASIWLVGFLMGCGGAAPAGGAATGGESSGESAESAQRQREDALVQSPKLLAPVKGTKAAESRFASIDFQLTLSREDGAPAGIQSASWSLDEKRSYEVVDVSGKVIRELRVTFGAREGNALLGLEPHAATSGQSFVVAAKGGKLSLAKPDGGSLSTNEEAGLSEYAWTGKPSPLLVWLDGGTVPSGEKRSGEAEHARALIGELPGVDPKKTKLEVTSKGESQGALGLDVHAIVLVESGPTILELDLTGPAQIDRKTGFVTELSLTGSVKPRGKMDTKKGLLAVSGSGKAEVRRRIEW